MKKQTDFPKMMRTKKEFRGSLKRFLSLSILGLVMGCHSAPKASTPPPLADELLRSLKEGRAEFKTIRAEGRAEYVQKNRKIRFHASILASFPDQFFLEAGGFGFPASLVAADSKELQLLIPARNEYYTTEAETGLKTLMGLDMSTKDWVGLLLGQIPYPPDQVMGLRREAKGWRVTAKFGSEVLHLSIEENSGWLRAIESQDDSSKKIIFGNPMKTSGGSYPSSIQIRRGDRTLTINFKTVVANPVIPPDQLRLDVPQGLTAKPMDPSQVLLGSE